MDLVNDLVYNSYHKAAPYLHGLDRDTRDISLTETLLEMLDLEYKTWECATVAGSKGKGSTAVMLAAILGAAGYRVGLVTSPHLRNFRERIRIDGTCVTDQQLYSAAIQIEPAIRQLESQLKPPRYIGPGGVILALAGTIFRASGVTAVVVEAGRGGEYDEARCVRASVSVITSVMLEHPDKLGATVEEIAQSKVLISRPKGTIVSGSQTPSVSRVLSRTADELGSRIIFANDVVAIQNRHSDLNGISFDLVYSGEEYRDLRIGLAGPHQIQNASTAIVAASQFPYRSQSFQDSVSTSLRSVRWPGRNQMLQSNPYVLIDGAINEESATYACMVAREWGAKSITAVVAVPMPKDLEGVCKAVSAVASQLILTEVPAPNLKWYKDPLTIAQPYFLNAQWIREFDKAISAALATASSRSGVLLLGTQSFVGAVLDRWNVQTCELWASSG